MKERTTLDRLESEAMRLSIAERAELARRLFASLEGDRPDSDDEVERAWIEEAEARYQRYLRCHAVRACCRLQGTERGRAMRKSGDSPRVTTTNRGVRQVSPQEILRSASGREQIRRTRELAKRVVRRSS